MLLGQHPSCCGADGTAPSDVLGRGAAEAGPRQRHECFEVSDACEEVV